MINVNSTFEELDTLFSVLVGIRLMAMEKSSDAFWDGSDAMVAQWDAVVAAANKTLDMVSNHPNYMPF